MYVHLCVCICVCVCIINIGLTVDTVAHTYVKLSNTCILSIKHVTLSLHLGTLDSTAALSSRATLNSNTTKKSTEYENMWH